MLPQKNISLYCHTQIVLQYYHTKNISHFCQTKNISQYQLAPKGALAHRLQNPIWPLGGPKMANGVFGHPKQLSLNKFFDPSTPSMRKVDNGEKKEKRKEKKKRK